MSPNELADEIRKTVDHFNTLVIQADALGLTVGLTICKSDIVRIEQLYGFCVDNLAVTITKRI